MTDRTQPSYLRPYADSARRFGGGFGSLLWASRATQRIRFDVMIGMIDFKDRIVVDAGAGRGDLLRHLLKRGIQPATYIGIEAVDALADRMEADALPGCQVVRGDFVKDPKHLFVGAEVVVFSGSLNTLPPRAFHTTLQRAFEATSQCVLFNFLSGPALAAAEHLHWHERADVETFIRSLTTEYRSFDTYLPGDCTIRADRMEDDTVTR